MAKCRKVYATCGPVGTVAPEIIRMGCFARVETNGGGFEQINLLFGKIQMWLLGSGASHLMMQVFKLTCLIGL